MDPALYQIMLVGMKADITNINNINDDDIDNEKKKIAQAIGITAESIHPLQLSAKCPNASTYHTKTNFTNELERQIRLIGNNDNLVKERSLSESKHDHYNDKQYQQNDYDRYQSDDRYVFLDTDESNQYESDFNCLCYFIKGLLLWGLFGCLGGALGALAGTIDQYDVLNSKNFHITNSVGNISLEGLTPVQRGTIVGASSGLITGFSILLICLCYKKCKRKSPKITEAYSNSSSDDLTMNAENGDLESNSSLSTQHRC